MTREVDQPATIDHVETVFREQGLQHPADRHFDQNDRDGSWAADEGFLDKVPGNNIKVGGLKKVAPGDLRDPNSPNQLSNILIRPLYTGYKSKHVRHKPGDLRLRDGYFWVPLIALFSGMRLVEIIQLPRFDVKQENGIWYFDVHKGEGKSLKTASSKRRVPLHLAVIELGLLKFVQAGPQSGRVF